MDKGEATGEIEDKETQNLIKITVKFSGRSIPINLSVDSTIKDLKSLLQPLTNVLPRGQKLISRGKLLVDEMKLRYSEITNGSKIMLIASQGLHQGNGPIKKEAPALPRRMAESNRRNIEKKDMSVQKTRLERWKATGVLALSESDLKAIPNEVWTCGPSARVLDLSHNFIEDVPASISCLTSVQKLFLNSNNISDESINWEGLSSLRSLTFMSLSQNHLTSLPSALGALTCLSQLHLVSNKLTCLPNEIGLLTKLQVLKANNNRISTISPCIGSCISLVEVDISSNLLVELPESFGNLRNLKALYLDNNGLKSLPATLLKMCTQLSTLELHGTEITMDLLREFDGWGNFDERRRLKHQKQLEFRVAGDAGVFDEGADKS